jgi:hypothetical protein
MLVASWKRGHTDLNFIRRNLSLPLWEPIRRNPTWAVPTNGVGIKLKGTTTPP